MKGLIVRSAFGNEDDLNLFPGVYRTITNVDPDRESILDSIEMVLHSRNSSTAASYRSLTDSYGSSRREDQIIIQEFVEVETKGIVSSYHPGSNRLDNILIETEEANEARHDVYSGILGRWISRASKLDQSQREKLLDILRVGEDLLAAPAIIEFGVFNGQVLVFQLRRAPPVEYPAVWTQGGPAGITPDALSWLQADTVFGENLEVTKESITRALNEQTRAEVHDSNIRCLLHEHRVYAEYTSIASPIRFFPDRTSLPGWAFRSMLRCGKLRRDLLGAQHRQHRRDLAPTHKASSHEFVRDIRTLAKLQARAQQQAEDFRALSRAAVLLGRKQPGFSPLIPWHIIVSKYSNRGALTMDEARRKLHETIVLKLDSMGDEIPAAEEGETIDLWRQMRLSEWLKAGGGDGVVDTTVLLQRQQAFEAAKARPAPTILTNRRGRLTAELEEKKHNGSDQHGKLLLHTIVHGKASGVVMWARPEAEVQDAIVIVSDSSVSWIEQIVGARGVLVIGGGMLLSHLALMLRELEIPTFSGLTPREAEELAGKTVEISNGEIRVRRTVGARHA